MAELEPRRLIKFGNSSFVVCLPQRWIKRNKMKKGDFVYIEENSDNDLILKLKKKPSMENSQISINVEGKNYNEVKREFTSAYIHNYNEIIFIGKDHRQRSEYVDKLLHEKIGFEIAEEDNLKTIVKDIFDFDAVSLEKLVRRFDNIIRSMFEDFIEDLSKGVLKEWTSKEIYKADIEVNKAYFLIMKIIRKCQENAYLLSSLKINFKSLFDLAWFAAEAEHIGDEIKRMARTLTKFNFSSDELKQLLYLMQILKNDYIDVMTAYYKNDKSLALEIWKRKEKYIHSCEIFFEKSQSPRIWEIIEKLKGIICYINNISKILAF